MNKDVQTKSVKTSHRIQRGIIYAVLLLGVYLLGFVPMWLQSREYFDRLSAAEHQLYIRRD